MSIRESYRTDAAIHGHHSDDAKVLKEPILPVPPWS